MMDPSEILDHEVSTALTAAISELDWTFIDRFLGPVGRYFDALIKELGYIAFDLQRNGDFTLTVMDINAEDDTPYVVLGPFNIGKLMVEALDNHRSEETRKLFIDALEGAAAKVRAWELKP